MIVKTDRTRGENEISKDALLYCMFTDPKQLFCEKNTLPDKERKCGYAFRNI